MKTLRIVCVLMLGLELALPAAAGGLANLVPGRPLLCLEAADLAASLASLRVSPQMEAWYRTAGYTSFRNTKLARKLTARLAEMEAVAGAGLNLQNLQAIAGGESALALYDIGRMQMLYLSRLPAAGQAAAFLDPLKKKFDQRKEGDLTYYAKAAEDGSLEFAFAQTGDLLAVSTQVDLVEKAVRAASVATQTADVLAADPRYARAAALQSGPADLRMFLDQTRLGGDNYFHAYWIHRNVPDLRWIDAAYVTARFHERGIEEHRVLLQASQAASAQPTASAPLGLLAAKLSGGFAYAQLAAAPSGAEIVDAIFQEVLDSELPSGGQGPSSELARTLGEAFGKSHFDAMARVIDPLLEKDEYYRTVPRAVVLFGASALPETSAVVGPVRSWYAEGLTGEADHPGLAVKAAGGVTSVELPFAVGRGFHVAFGDGKLVLATHASLAARLAAAAPPAGAASALPVWRPGPLRSLRWLDLPACRAAFGAVVERTTGPGDDLRRYFETDWEGLLSSFSRVRSVADSTWVEGDAVRQTIEFGYEPGK
ncbi:MAG: hypothetical protein HY303_21640 [Candidatus Wallbacteria bacterium]|nr:hypothetical protein [Candidatus Wallbacteria bacterium]